MSSSGKPADTSEQLPSERLNFSPYEMLLNQEPARNQPPVNVPTGH